MKKPIFVVFLFLLFFSNMQIANAAVAMKSHSERAENFENKQKATNNATPSIHKISKKTEEKGKSQVVALVLAIIVGTLGVHRFYLGYTGRGILMLLLSTVGSLLFGLGAIVSFVLAIIDIIKIATGELGPADGSEYTQKM